MSIQSALRKGIKEYQTVFKEEITEMQRKVISGSPVDTGRFKTSWQLIEFDPKKLRFRMINPVEYGLALWMYGTSLQGWSPAGGQQIVEETERNIKTRYRMINKFIFRA